MRRAAGGSRFRCRTAAGIVRVLLAAALSGWPGVPQADALRSPVLGVDVVREKAEAFIRAQGRDPGRYRLESCRYDYEPISKFPTVARLAIFSGSRRAWLYDKTMPSFWPRKVIGGENRRRPRGLRATPTPAALRRWPVQRVLCCAARLAGAAVDSQRDARGILR